MRGLRRSCDGDGHARLPVPGCLIGRFPPERGQIERRWAVHGEPGLPSALTAKKWGFSDVLFGGKRLAVPRPYGSYVMENVLFKIAFPAEFHAQTAAECAILTAVA